MSSTTTPAITNSSFCDDPAKTITRGMGSSFPTVTRWYAHLYLTGDQIQERGKNLNTMTKGETYSDLWMDNLIYATTIHASNHLCTNGNLDGYIMLVVILVFGADPLCCRMLNKLLMRGLFDLEIPPEQSNHWVACLMRYTAAVGTKLFSYIESLWETAEEDQKAQNDHARKIHKLEHKILVQGHALEDQDDMIHKLSGIVEKQEKAMEVLTAKILHLETINDDNGEWLNNFSYHLGVLELPQQMRESGSNPLVLDLIHPHFGSSCSVFSRMASHSSFVSVVNWGLSRELHGGGEFQFQWSVCQPWSLSRGSRLWSS